MKSINTKDELKTKLDINDIKELNSKKNQKKFIEIIKDNEISPELFKEILTVTPILAETFNQMFRTMGDIGNSIEETKKLRWEIIKELAMKDKLSSDQILEAMKLLKEIEKNESIDWTKIFASVAGGVVVAIGLFFASKNKTN